MRRPQNKEKVVEIKSEKQPSSKHVRTCSMIPHRTTIFQSYLKSHWKILSIKEIQSDKCF